MTDSKFNGIDPLEVYQILDLSKGEAVDLELWRKMFLFSLVQSKDLDHFMSALISLIISWQIDAEIAYSKKSEVREQGRLQWITLQCNIGNSVEFLGGDYSSGIKQVE